MKSFLIVFSFIGLLSCSYSPKEHSPKEHSSTNNTSKTHDDPNKTSKTHDDPNKIIYNKLTDGLKRNYVLYYRDIKSTGGDVTIWGMPDTDSVFRLDSIQYSESYRDFFNQDGDFINWLLSFKYDTTKFGLWGMFHNPKSSYISECNLPKLSNSRAAIVLLENFLTGHGFRCFECEYNDRQRCNFDKYVEIETFLFTNKKKDITELRTAWQKRKDRLTNK